MSGSDSDQTSDDGAGDLTRGLRADYSEPGPAPGATAAAGLGDVQGLPLGCAVLVVTRGPNAGSRFLLDQPLSCAGRHPGSDIVLDHGTVSRRHAEFRCDSGEFRVVDAGSLNGTRVNRRPVDSARLANGDEIQIGDFRLVFLTQTTIR